MYRYVLCANVRWQAFNLGFFAMAMSSCTRAISDKSLVSVKFPEATTIASKATAQSQIVGALATSKWQLTASSPTQLNCFVVSVKMPEASHGVTCSNLAGALGTTDLLFGGFPQTLPQKLKSLLVQTAKFP